MNRVVRILVGLVSGSLLGLTLAAQETSTKSGQTRREDPVQVSGRDESQQRSASSSSRRAFRLRPDRTSVTLGDQKISITFGPLEVTGLDYKNLETQPEGTVVRFVESFAVKLLTDVDLRCGEIVVKANNVHDDYPGVYALWLKKTAGGWALVFNEEADVWGTMHNPEHDVAEVPLDLGSPAEPAEKLTFELSEVDGGAQLRIVWGSYEWMTLARPVS